MSRAIRQLWALLVLRWQMVRGAAVKLAGIVMALCVGWLVHVVATGAAALDGPTLAAALEVAPLAFLGFGALALVAPLTAGGGQQVVPPDQLVAYAVRPGTLFLGGLLLAPFNLVWVIQLLVLAMLTGCLTLDGALVAGSVTTAAYVLCLTTIGQALAWWVAGLRQSRAGRRAVSAGGAGLVLLVVVLVRLGLDQRLGAPTRGLVAAVSGDETQTLTTVLLLAGAAAGGYVGARVCGWVLRLPDDAAAGGRIGPRRRRSARSSPLRELVAVDRASIWRAPALRRGGLVLAVLPGLMAAGAGVPWESLIVLPGLVAAGTGLLFGINAFALDGSGAVWLASLPHDPGRSARAKALVLTETVLAAVFIAAAAGSLRSPGAPTASELSGIVAAGVACTALVVAQCMHSSVRRPHRADLRGPRDAVAPPGALALASVRLALPAGFVGLWIAAASSSGRWWLPIGFALPVVLLAGLSLGRSLRRYGDPGVRARVVQVVAAG